VKGVQSQEAIEQLFTKVRTHHDWLDRPVGVDLLKAVWDLAKMGPTSALCRPGRFQ
jgi:3-hydroxypropanoate dehydrogenase